jgi:N-methylhydantoinase A
MYLGVDIGGTFTDLVLMDEDGSITTTKSLTTPDRLEDGVFDAIALVAKGVGLTTEELLARVPAFGHGTTQATNALIERTGAKTGLVTTRGFGDTLLVQRLMGFTAGVAADQLGWYSHRRYPDPVVPRGRIREVTERVDQSGRVLVPLDEAEVAAAIESLNADGVETFAIAFLWSFRHPAHEQRAAAIVRERCPGAYVSLSCEVAPIIGEYERTATTAMNSYLAPKVADYLNRVEDALRERGFRGAFRVLNSTGGVMPAREAARKPVVLLASGPTGGVLGSLHLAAALGERNVITTDMGGTSFDVALIIDGKPVISAPHEVGGYHLNTPMVDIRAVGAGGGSIARIDGGTLRVGPDSAGAFPGPVCYGRGGKLATVTDADVVLGIIDPDFFLGGRMPLDRAAAEAAIRTQIAEPLGLPVERAAAGIRRVIDSHMADTLREVTIGRGHDPRDFVLFAYGGAGPVHCAGFGADLGVPRIVVPATSMVHSAYGALASDVHQSAERSLMLHGGGGPREPSAGIDPAVIASVFAELEAACAAAMAQSGFAPGDITLVRSVDMRYRRQVNDLLIPFDSGPVTGASVRAVVARFEETYEQVYGKDSGFRMAGVEMTTFRVEALGRTVKPQPRAAAAAGTPQQRTRRIFEPVLERWVEADVRRWAALPVGHAVAGPAVIEHPETVVFVAAGQTARVDALGNLIIDTRGSAA